MGRIDKKKEIIIIYGNKSKYLMGNLKLLGCDYGRLEYWYYGTKIALDLGNSIKKGVLKNKPKKEVLSVLLFSYLMAK